ncbi:MAG: thioredoxin [Chloroflexi bacterium]|nr:thioredoxin [Chloroflexota bacterium]
MAELRETTEATWQGDVLAAAGPVLVDFWAEWCAPCRMMEPMLAQLADRLADNLTIIKADVQAHPDLAARYGVQNLPALVLFKQGEAVEHFAGPMPLRVLETRVRQHL